MSEARLSFLNTSDPDRPVEEKYVAEIDSVKKSFISKEDAMIFLFDNGVRAFKYLTKSVSEYKDHKKLPTYEFWQLENRVGYVLYDNEMYVHENDELKKRKAFVWRFIGYGQSCFAPTREELVQKVSALIQHYKEDPKQHGHNSYPYYTKYYR